MQILALTWGRKAGPAALAVSQSPCSNHSWTGPVHTAATARKVLATRLRVLCSAIPPLERIMHPTASASAARLRSRRIHLAISRQVAALLPCIVLTLHCAACRRLMACYQNKYTAFCIEHCNISPVAWEQLGCMRGARGKRLNFSRWITLLPTPMLHSPGPS